MADGEPNRVKDLGNPHPPRSSLARCGIHESSLIYLFFKKATELEQDVPVIQPFEGRWKGKQEPKGSLSRVVTLCLTKQQNGLE